VTLVPLQGEFFHPEFTAASGECVKHTHKDLGAARTKVLSSRHPFESVEVLMV